MQKGFIAVRAAQRKALCKLQLVLQLRAHSVFLANLLLNQTHMRAYLVRIARKRQQTQHLNHKIVCLEELNLQLKKNHQRAQA